MSYWKLLLISVLLCIFKIHGHPIIEEFEDKWDFKISPHNKPILNGTTRNHILQAAAKRQSKDYHEEFEARKKEIRNPAKEIGDAVRRKISCSVCKIGVLLLKTEVKKGSSFSEIKEKFVSVCVGFEIENEIVCSGLFDVYSPDLLPALNETQIGPPQICSLCLGEVCGEIENPLHEWEVEFPDVPKPEVTELDPPLADKPTFKVLHLSDTHLDLNYIEGSPSNCEEPLCCHSYSTPSEKEPQISAGKWGSYGKCDSPKVLIENMFRNIVEQHPDIDYIIWTGDLPAHDVWNQTREGNLQVLKETVKQMFEAFPNIPIFPALGNHESVPAGSFAPPWMDNKARSISWLYDEVSAQWNKWLPSAVNNSVNHGAFYSVLIRPGFRLISLNTNYCYTISWWLLLNSTDPAKELEWLIYELQEAENNGEKVHIIGHVPPGDSDCMKVWSKNLYSIVNRYESTITAQFYGHRHSDEFEIFYDTADYKRPTNIAFMGPSVTTYENYNPGYRIYYVDGDHNETTTEVIEHETWIMDLEKANSEKEEDPKWFRLYTAREAYGLSTLRAKDWSEIIDKMIFDDKLFKLFYRFYYKNSPTRPVCDDNKCKLQILCDLKSAKSHKRHHLCNELEDILRT